MTTINTFLEQLTERLQIELEHDPEYETNPSASIESQSFVRKAMGLPPEPTTETALQGRLTVHLRLYSKTAYRLATLILDAAKWPELDCTEHDLDRELKRLYDRKLSEYIVPHIGSDIARMPREYRNCFEDREKYVRGINHNRISEVTKNYCQWRETQQGASNAATDNKSQVASLTMTEALLFKIAMGCPDLDLKTRGKPSHWEVFLAAWKEGMTDYQMEARKRWKRRTAGNRLHAVEVAFLGRAKVSGLLFDPAILRNVETQLHAGREHAARIHRQDLLDNTTETAEDEGT